MSRKTSGQKCPKLKKKTSLTFEVKAIKRRTMKILMKTKFDGERKRGSQSTNRSRGTDFCRENLVARSLRRLKHPTHRRFSGELATVTCNR